MEKEAFLYTIKIVAMTMIMGVVSSTLLYYIGITMTMILAVLGIMSLFVGLVYLNQIKILRKMNREEINELKLRNPYPEL
jgi:membrane protein YdbS with pleckstrin-like domain